MGTLPQCVRIKHKIYENSVSVPKRQLSPNCKYVYTKHKLTSVANHYKDCQYTHFIVFSSISDFTVRIFNSVNGSFVFLFRLVTLLYGISGPKDIVANHIFSF